MMAVFFLFKVFFEFLAATVFEILSWPSFALICPLVASIRAMETDTHSTNQQCLAFWILFALLAFLEESLGKLLVWFPFWPYVKGVMTVLFVIPYFGGASYVYNSFVRKYPIGSSQIFFLIWNIFFIPMRECLPFVSSLFQRRKCLSISETDENGIVDGQGILDKPIIFQQGFFKPDDDEPERDHTPLMPKCVQNEWSCALCLFSTTSEKCLKEHLGGRKHKAKQEVQAKELALKLTYDSSLMVNRVNGMVLLGNLVKLENWRGLISPVTRPIRWCKWTMPDAGWIKLNTDGSIDRENACFGGLLRDHTGTAICAFVSKAALRDIFLVELWAIWRGLVLALGLGVKAVWVESDSMSAVKTINKEQSHSGKADECLKHIWVLLKKFDDYRISHALRESNKAADFLSKMVLQRSDVVLRPVHFPKMLKKIIRDDAEGRIYCRR